MGPIGFPSILRPNLSEEPEVPPETVRIAFSVLVAVPSLIKIPVVSPSVFPRDIFPVPEILTVKEVEPLESIKTLDDKFDPLWAVALIALTPAEFIAWAKLSAVVDKLVS